MMIVSYRSSGEWHPRFLEMPPGESDDKVDKEELNYLGWKLEPAGP